MLSATQQPLAARARSFASGTRAVSLRGPAARASVMAGRGRCLQCRAVLQDPKVSPGNGGNVEITQPGVIVEVPRVANFGTRSVINSPFCTTAVCRPDGRSAPRNVVNQHSAFVSDDDKILLSAIAYGNPTSAGASETCTIDGCDFLPQWCTRAGPRANLHFDPSTVKAAIVTCGGLCPGLNDVIRQIVITLEVGYGVQSITGIPYGYRGFFEEGLQKLNLTKEFVRDIHLEGGSVLGTSRGGGDVKRIVDSMQAMGINQLYVLGGNGTHAGAQAIFNECSRREYECAVVGVPKTIDNDILHIDKTFGFDTAVEAAQKALRAAAIEAKSGYRGVGVVKLMGRQSGFIAMYASIASGEVDLCLIPEVKFAVDGPNGVLAHVDYLLETQGHAIICLAEGAGQEYVVQDGLDPSGNPILGDIGPWFVKKIKKGLNADVKYIDPTYMVRGVAANAHDKVYCNVLGQNAAHAAMAGFTGCSVVLVNTHYAYLPIPMLIERPRYVDPSSRMYQRLVGSTGQPDFF